MKFVAILKEIWVNLEDYFNLCKSLTDKFPKYVAFMIISAVVVGVFYYNPLFNYSNTSVVIDEFAKLRAFHVFVPYVPYAPCSPYLRALVTRF